MLQLVSSIGLVEQVRRGWVVRATYDPEFGEFVLSATSRRGQGKQRLLPSWTELYREQPALAKKALLRCGAQVTINHLSLLG